MPHCFRQCLTSLFWGLFVFGAQAQITGIKSIGDTCANFTLDLQVVGTSNSSYFFWNFGDPSSGMNDTITITGLSPTPNPTHTFSSAGVYTVCAMFQEPGFPVSTVCRNISIGLCCNGIIFSTDTCIQNPIPFSIISGTPITSIIWDFGDPLSGANNTSTSFAPTHLFSASGTYTIRSIVNFSCNVDTVDKIVKIVPCDSIKESCQVFVPNIFSPNDDGKNDTFYPLTICAFEQYECLVFTRWGGLIYKASNQSERWDGKYEGADCSDGVYVYSITYKFPSQQTKNTRGTITLLR